MDSDPGLLDSSLGGLGPTQLGSILSGWIYTASASSEKQLEFIPYFWAAAESADKNSSKRLFKNVPGNTCLFIVLGFPGYSSELAPRTNRPD